MVCTTSPCLAQFCPCPERNGMSSGWGRKLRPGSLPCAASTAVGMQPGTGGVSVHPKCPPARPNEEQDYFGFFVCCRGFVCVCVFVVLVFVFVFLGGGGGGDGLVCVLLLLFLILFL